MVSPEFGARICFLDIVDKPHYKSLSTQDGLQEYRDKDTKQITPGFSGTFKMFIAYN